jgi:transcriptional regulator NrdR family protein
VAEGKRLQAFERDKLLLSIHDSLKHRKTAVRDATGLTDTVISQLYPLMRQTVVEKTGITAVTLVVLKRFDKTAATHYAAFHPAS